MYRYARSLSRDPEVAQEMVQEACRRALTTRARPCCTEDAVRAWLFTVVRNLWHNETRARRRHLHVASSDDFEIPGEPLEEEINRRLLLSEVRDAIDSLPDVFREVVMLRDVQGLSYAEIAGILECPAGTVMSRLSRARDLLRKSLAASGLVVSEMRR